MTQPRKNWLHHHFGFAQLVGIGGPGAPHSMRLDRIGSTGAVLKTIVRTPLFRNIEISWYLRSFPVLQPTPGIRREDVDCKFWSKYAYTPSPSDVILRTVFWCFCVWWPCFDTLNIGCVVSYLMSVMLSHHIPSFIPIAARTKQWMSDSSWQPHIFLLLPASVAHGVGGDSPPGATIKTSILSRYCLLKPIESTWSQGFMWSNPCAATAWQWTILKYSIISIIDHVMMLHGVIFWF